MAKVVKYFDVTNKEIINSITIIFDSMDEYLGYARDIQKFALDKLLYKPNEEVSDGQDCYYLTQVVTEGNTKQYALCVLSSNNDIQEGFETACGLKPQATPLVTATSPKNPTPPAEPALTTDGGASAGPSGTNTETAVATKVMTLPANLQPITIETFLYGPSQDKLHITIMLIAHFNINDNIGNEQVSWLKTFCEKCYPNKLIEINESVEFPQNPGETQRKRLLTLKFQPEGFNAQELEKLLQQACQAKPAESSVAQPQATATATVAASLATADGNAETAATASAAAATPMTAIAAVPTPDATSPAAGSATAQPDQNAPAGASAGTTTTTQGMTLPAELQAITISELSLPTEANGLIKLTINFSNDETTRAKQYNDLKTFFADNGYSYQLSGPPRRLSNTSRQLMIKLDKPRPDYTPLNELLHNTFHFLARPLPFSLISITQDPLGNYNIVVQFDNIDPNKIKKQRQQLLEFLNSLPANFVMVSQDAMPNGQEPILELSPEHNGKYVWTGSYQVTLDAEHRVAATVLETTIIQEFTKPTPPTTVEKTASVATTGATMFAGAGAAAGSAPPTNIPLPLKIEVLELPPEKGQIVSQKHWVSVCFSSNMAIQKAQKDLLHRQVFNGSRKVTQEKESLHTTPTEPGTVWHTFHVVGISQEKLRTNLEAFFSRPQPIAQATATATASATAETAGTEAGAGAPTAKEKPEPEVNGFARCRM